MDDFQRCIACSRPLQLSSAAKFCECGHVVKDALKKENTRKRKAPTRPDSISSEWIGCHVGRVPKINVKKKPTTVDKKNSSLGLCLTNSKRKFVKSPLTTKNNSNDDNKDLEKNKEKAREILDLIDKSYKNSYFSRCKSFRKFRTVDVDFEFDFSSFETDSPYYPKALEYINAKIIRMNGIWNQLGQFR
ncbi:uncharacterized protein LOC124806876 isoform X1 [Hydra vulgaris]|uniref:Uncharacterized protein LOC124806876 isoform X1 n=1 Tax=Hydra vulgaris TaxID=6087 RepID=A0ABM4BYF1_HYDVU